MSRVLGLNVPSFTVGARWFADRIFNALFVSGEHSMSIGLYSCPGGSCTSSVADNIVDGN
ncbi:hypothetical protein [Methanococcoides alaskense]|uniref:Uncharacterized protein n=1 Tax=Methanococcoides alaskense TaxID=325778 RepID=A0AA90Z7A1_9EURY|nr:hypothetical protein [Methanococcoides alaskense]MDA0524989.1 hypothetical protein [Methanococcoides alaskense]MDR6222096.1 hypothetical protein [Methanococcoides alaskense]